MHARTTLYHVGGWPYNSMADAREGLIVVGWGPTIRHGHNWGQSGRKVR